MKGGNRDCLLLLAPYKVQLGRWNHQASCLGYCDGNMTKNDDNKKTDNKKLEEYCSQSPFRDK